MSEGERLKTLRKTLNIKQGDFADKISTTQGHISDIENGRKTLSDRTMKLICLENWDGKMVNEAWLRTGEGEMFIQVSEEDDTAALVYSLLGSKKNELYEIILAVIRSYQELSPASQQVILEYSRNLLKNLQKKNVD